MHLIIDNDIMIFIHVILLRIDKFAFILFAQTDGSNTSFKLPLYRLPQDNTMFPFENSNKHITIL